MVRIRLTQLPRRLAELTGRPAPTYRKCFDYVAGARFPAEFVNNRWSVAESDLPVIAVALGMAPEKTVENAPRSRRPAATISDATA